MYVFCKFICIKQNALIRDGLAIERDVLKRDAAHLVLGVKSAYHHGGCHGRVGKNADIFKAYVFYVTVQAVLGKQPRCVDRYADKQGMIDAALRRIGRSHIALIDVGKLVACVFDIYVLKGHVGDVRSVVMVDVHKYGRAVYTIASSENYVLECFGVGLCTYFKISAPITPSDTILDKDIFHILVIPTAYALEDYAVVKATQKAICDDTALTVK